MELASYHLLGAETFEVAHTLWKICEPLFLNIAEIISF